MTEEASIFKNIGDATSNSEDSLPCQEEVQRFPFLRLPAEVRTMIYNEHLIQPSAIEASFSDGYAAYLGGVLPRRGYALEPESSKSRRIPQAPIISFFRVSRDILAESLPIYFHYNTFHFHVTPLVEDFIKSIPVRARLAIRSLEVQIDWWKPATAAKTLALCPNLQRLNLTFSVRLTYKGSENGMPPYNAMKICGLNHLLKLRGIQDLSVNFEEWDNIDPNDRFSNWNKLVKALQVVKKPRSKASESRRLKRNFSGSGQSLKPLVHENIPKKGRVGKRELASLQG